MIIGSKQSFGIELNIASSEKYLMGSARLWLGRSYIGSIEDVNIVGCLISDLNRICAKPQVKDERLILGDPNSEFHLIRNDFQLHDECLPGLGEGFDDFEVYVYRFGSTIRFLWRLYGTPFFKYPNYPAGPQVADVAAADIWSVRCALKTYIDSEWKN